ncbi:hypothetical protein [Amorphus orientalis]|uniref:Uncharacterized protein n=1 Tax=Amorphus orientalis TaxID=649198 RepID=A0AAE4ASA6_9HYPH|nr:hypothetical protein [Amorphus orientalis]MDQ0314820.1 hypothetical protein [Amorphus orientalis]
MTSEIVFILFISLLALGTTIPFAIPCFAKWFIAMRRRRSSAQPSLGVSSLNLPGPAWSGPGSFLRRHSSAAVTCGHREWFAKFRGGVRHG